MQCEKRQLRRKIALAEAERRDDDAKAARARFATLEPGSEDRRSWRSASPSSSRGCARAPTPRTCQAISLQQREAFYRCE